MLTKICSKCKKEKTLNDYYKLKNGKYGVHSICKKCTESIRRLRNEKLKSKAPKKILPKVQSLESEVWKDISGYEGLYQVSNLGRVKSLERYRKTKHLGDVKSGYIQREKILSEKFNKTSNPNLNYSHTNLCKDGVMKEYCTHRLVAIAFIKNPLNKPYINHKDGNGLNNNVNNLEWSTNRENQEHAVRILKHSHNKPIIAFNKKSMKKELAFEVMVDASKWLLKNNITKDKWCLTGIIKCCKKKIPSYLGYVWRYKEEVVDGATVDKITKTSNTGN